MTQTFCEFLRRRSERSFRLLLSEIAGLTERDVFQFRTDNWPDHRWGVGQDGSISGIVYHVAAWKQLTLPIFEPGGRPLTRAEFDAAAAPRRDNWPAIESWLRLVGEEWNARLNDLPDDEFDSTRNWEGVMLPLSSFAVEMLEHDIQHTSQIAYIKQRIISEKPQEGASRGL